MSHHLGLLLKAILYEIVYLLRHKVLLHQLREKFEAVGLNRMTEQKWIADISEDVEIPFSPMLIQQECLPFTDC
jgi:hypothetical protein